EPGAPRPGEASPRATRYRHLIASGPDVRSTHGLPAAVHATGSLSAREALGHYGPLERPRVATFFAATPEGARLVTVEGVSAADQRRAGRYMRAAQGLARGTYRTPAGELLVGAAAERDFQRRFSRWQPIAGMAIVSDPATVTALVVENREAGAEVHYDSGRSRPGRRRRTRSPSRRRSRSSSSSRSTAARSSRSGGASNQGEGLVELFDEAMVGVDEALEDAADALRDMGDDLR
ncbi:MAG: hypothetical protein M0Z95_29620, partial [Actinomycetota bacterium]|nr:hypothetical protein [Actinomycetota bacterium]